MATESGLLGSLINIGVGNVASGSIDAEATIQSQVTSDVDAELRIARTATATQFDARLSVVQNVSGIGPTALIITPVAIDASGLPPYTVSFLGSGTPVGDRTIVQYTWFFNDINTTVSGGTTTEHIFATSGSFLTTLRVTDSDGFVGFDSVRVITHSGIVLELPGLETSGSPILGNAPLSVTFTSLASGVAGTTIEGYSWSFGNGLYSKRQNPNDIVYQIPSYWLPVCTVVDSRGVRSADSIQIGINN